MHEKTNNLGFRPGLTQTRLYSHRRQLEAITAKLICAFVFAYADCLFSYAGAHLLSKITLEESVPKSGSKVEEFVSVEIVHSRLLFYHSFFNVVLRTGRFYPGINFHHFISGSMLRICLVARNFIALLISYHIAVIIHENFICM